MLEPLRMYAYIPRLLNAYGRLEQAESKMDILSPRHRALAELKSATTVRCEYCIDLGSAIARRWGLTDEELLAMSDYQNATCFSDARQADSRVRHRDQPHTGRGDRRAVRRPARAFRHAQLVGLTHVITLGNLRARFNLALGIGASGFSEGRVCALPDTGRRDRGSRTWQHVSRRRGRIWVRWPTACWARSTTPRTPCRRPGCG